MTTVTAGDEGGTPNTHESEREIDIDSTISEREIMTPPPLEASPPSPCKILRRASRPFLCQNSQVQRNRLGT